MRGQELSVVRDAGELVLVDVMQRVGESHVAVAVVMTICLAVGSDVDELGMGSGCRESADEAMSEVLAARQELLERDAARDRAVVEENRDRPAGRERAAIGQR